MLLMFTFAYTNLYNKHEYMENLCDFYCVAGETFEGL